jgi:hypothetical protein
VAATIRQTARGFSAASDLTFDADFGDDLGACLEGSLILWIIAGDKAAGTITPPSECPNLPINLQSNDATLALAWGVAEGGEEIISGSVAVNAAGGQVFVVEVIDDASSGSWGRRSTDEHYTASGGATTDTVALGPAPAATGPGVGIAAVGFDSVNTAGTPGWTNGWASRAITNSGGGQAGLWAASKEGIATDDTESTTFSRTGGSLDQAHGFLVVFGRDAASVDGVLAAVMPEFGSAALVGDVTIPAELAAVMPEFGSAALVGDVTVTGALAGVLPEFRGTLAEVVPLAAGVRVALATLEPSGPAVSGVEF